MRSRVTMSESHASPKSAAHASSHAHVVPHAGNVVRASLGTGVFNDFLGTAFFAIASFAGLVLYLSSSL